MATKSRLKHLSSTVFVCLAILNRFAEPVSLDEIVIEYEEMFDISRRSICTYLNRVQHLGFIQSHNAGTKDVTWEITNDGQIELQWWKDMINA